MIEFRFKKFNRKQFGKKPRYKGFKPPKATRGGWTGFFNTPQEDPLTGVVQGLKAAQGEERLARTLDKAISSGLVTRYYFRMSPLIPKQMPGWKELDFLIETFFQPIAISVKGAGFVHLGSTEADKFNEMLLKFRLDKLGYKVHDIITVFDYELTTQKDADNVGRRLGIYR